MPSNVYRPPFIRRVHIDARPEDVFAYVADLSRHPEWAGGPLQVEAVSDGPIGVGSKYRSVGRMKGRLGIEPPVDFRAELTVTEYNPPTRFAFIAKEGNLEFLNEFTIQPQNGGTLVERNTTVDIHSLAMLILSKLLIRPLFAAPMTDRCLRRLKERLEGATKALPETSPR